MPILPGVVYVERPEAPGQLSKVRIPKNTRASIVVRGATSFTLSSTKSTVVSFVTDTDRGAQGRLLVLLSHDQEQTATIEMRDPANPSWPWPTLQAQVYTLDTTVASPPVLAPPAPAVSLSPAQVEAAIRYNQRLRRFLRSVRVAVGLDGAGDVDEELVRRVAVWQAVNMGAPRPDGRVDPRTEAHLNLQHPKALVAMTFAVSHMLTDKTLFDSWGNDLRDNDMDGLVDNGRELHAEDGDHFDGTSPSFRVIAGTYGTTPPAGATPAGNNWHTEGLGWGHDQQVVVSATRVVTGPFIYRVCADIASRALAQAGILARTTHRTGEILQGLRDRGYVWQMTESYPSEYLPGDFIATFSPAAGGHSGIVMERCPTTQNPMVVELPGPSTLSSEGTYDPTVTNDVALRPWSKGTSMIVDDRHPEYSDIRAGYGPSRYLGRALQSKFT